MDLGPMEILYCWQSIVLSSSVHVCTGVFKNTVMLTAGSDRIKRAWSKQVILPLIPLFLGVLFSLVFPIHPDYLSDYVEVHSVSEPWLVFAAWGGAVGTFADYIHQRVRGVLQIHEAHKETSV